MNKFYNKKVEYDGIMFDSTQERNRYIELKNALERGEISELNIHPKFELIPAQKQNNRVVERALTYSADFSYYKDGEYVVEDVKSKFTAKNKEYIIKRKLMLWIKGIRITEVINGRTNSKHDC